MGFDLSKDLAVENTKVLWVVKSNDLLKDFSAIANRSSLTKHTKENTNKTDYFFSY